MIESIGAVITSILGVGVVGLYFFACIVLFMKIIDCHIVQWFFSRGDHVTISFETFYKMYNIAPEKYRIDVYDFSVQYNDDIWIYMKSLFDCFKLLRFTQKMKSTERINLNNEKMLRLVQQWQDDIDEFNKMKGYL